jgi:heme exporter protein C
MKHIARLVHIAMPATVVMAFLYAPAADVHGETGRLLFFHVPLAWVAALAFAVAGVLSIVHLADRKGHFAHLDAKARNSASVGLAATVLATATGSVWAKMSWGSFWNWDPRQTSIIILMLIYIAYFSLDSALAGKENRGRVASAYLIMALAAMPFFLIIFPRLFGTLHPQSGSLETDIATRITLLASIAAHTLLYLYLFSLKNRIYAIEYTSGSAH